MYIKKIVLLFSFLFLSFLLFVNNIFAEPVWEYIVNDKEKLFGDVFFGDEHGVEPIFRRLPEDLQEKLFGCVLVKVGDEHGVEPILSGLPEDWRFMGRGEENIKDKLSGYVHLGAVKLKEKQGGIVISMRIDGVKSGGDHMEDSSLYCDSEARDKYWTSAETIYRLVELRKSLVERTKAIKGIELKGEKFIINDKKQLFGKVLIVNEGENIPEKLPTGWYLDDDYIYSYDDLGSRKKELDGYLYIDKVDLEKKGQDTIIHCKIGSRLSLESSNLPELKKKIERLEKIEEIEIWIDPELERELSAVSLN